ncbi:MAG: hypothetical protein M3065_03645, partial [Actinomycetota bacterium]|nr:hypothetical protein [Actinomycetota bacterium]
GVGRALPSLPQSVINTIEMSIQVSSRCALLALPVLRMKQQCLGPGVASDRPMADVPAGTRAAELSPIRSLDRSGSHEESNRGAISPSCCSS